MTTTAVTTKAEFKASAKKSGVEANYSGVDNVMFISGDDKKVKSFIRVCCLKGKGAFAFGVKQK